MKIVYFSNAKIPSRAASTVHIMKMCQAFSENGHDVTLLVREALEKDDDKLFGFYGVPKCFEIKQVTTKNSIAYGLKAANIVKRYSPDIVYGRFVLGCFLSSILRFNTAWESHAPLRNFNSITRWIISNLIIKRIKKIVVISEALKEHYIHKYKINPQNIIVCHDAADEDNGRKKLSFDTDYRFHVGYIGHLYQGKGMEIISPLAKMCPWAFFHIIGGLESDIKKWQSELRNCKNIKFYGFMPYVETFKYRRSFDAVLAPYQKKVIGFGSGQVDISKWMSPLKIFEYMASSRPIIVSDLPVLREILEDRYDALFCVPDNVESWVHALEELMNNKNFSEYLGSNALAKFKKKYTWKSRAMDILQYVTDNRL